MGKAERFYGNPFCFLAHMTGRLSPERGRISNQNNKSRASTPVCVAGTRNWRLPQSLRAHTEPLDCQAADSTAAILWRKKNRGGSTDCRVSFETGANKSGIQCVYASFPNLYTPRRKGRKGGGKQWNLFSFILASLCALFFFYECAIISTVQHQHGQTAQTALKLKRTHAQLHIFRSNQLQ